VRPLTTVQAHWRVASWLLLGSVTALVAGTVVVNYFPVVGATAQSAVLDTANVVAALIAAFVCALAAQAVKSRRGRLAWGLLALAFFMSFLAEGVWSYYQEFARVEVPFPSAADVFYLAFYPFAFVGTLLLANRSGGRLNRTTMILDSLVFTLGTAGLAWQLVIGPSLTGAEGVLSVALSVAYPVGDLLLIFALCSLFLRMDLGYKEIPALFLLACFAAQVGADLGFTWLTLRSEYATGSPVDPLWTLAYALAAVAAYARLRNLRGDARESAGESRAFDLGALRLVRLLIPYGAFPAAATLIVLNLRKDGSWGDLDTVVVILLALLIFGLVMVRQFLTLLENTRLSRSLEALSEELEHRVAERTAELSELNRVSAALSRCLVTDQALQTGLEHACQAVSAQAGAVWLQRSAGNFELVARRNLSEELSERLDALTRDSPNVRRAVAARVPTVFHASTAPVLDDVLGAAASFGGRLLLVPLLSRGSVLGSMGLIQPAEAPADEAIQELAQAIGAQLGVAVENAQQYESARYLAERDSVTGIRNHRALQSRLEEECRRAQRGDTVFSLVMMDLDGFKLFNDTYGHPSGDDALRQVASILSSTVRDSDVVGRYGGDEFMAILPDTDSQAAVKLCERVRGRMVENPYQALDGDAIPLHLSFGVASYPVDGREVNELIGLADASLYNSKQRGGDQITSPTTDDEDSPARSNSMFSVLDGLVTTVDAKDRYTRHHSEDVTELALAMAETLALSEETQRALRIAGLLHDVGKIGVPDRILRKPGKLTDDEFDVVKQHATLGEVIVKEIPNLHEVIGAVGSHHERWDGRGYPRGLQGTQIPYLGRMLAVADAWSAMTSDRPYRKRLSQDEARAELVRVSGSQLDPALVETFLLVLDRSGRELETVGGGVPAGD